MSTPKLPTDRIVFQFEHATVIYTCEDSAATGRKMPKLYIQAIDRYRYQREWSIAFRHTPGDSSKLFWESHAYRHPGRRNIVELTDGVAKRLIARILHLCENYPTLLFNGDNGDRARHESFVHLSEALLDGAAPSVSLLS